jgi:hypothetical protein
MRLGLQAGTQLNVRLRGSGLNVEALGELVWIGAKQKEVGIRFENIPEKTRQEIAGWIDQQRSPRQASFGDTSPLRPMSPIPGVSAPWDKSAPHPFAALGISEEKAVDPLASLSVDEDNARLAPLLDSQGDASSVSPHLETTPLVRGIQGSSRMLENSSVSADLNLDAPRSRAPAAPGAPGAEETLQDVRLLELPPAEALPELPAASPEAVERAPGAAAPEPPARAGISKVSAGPPASVEPYKAPALKAAPQPVYSWLASHLPEVPEIDVERWVPPALLDAWRGGTPRHRLLLAGGATLSLGFFALLLVLAASHTPGSGASPGPQPQIQQLRTEQRNAPRPAPAPEQPQKPEATPLEKFVKFFVGSDTENPDDAAPPPLPQIREDQLGVQVWISKTSGYFYCTDDPSSKTVSPGALMPQGDALQNGYRPILNQFCD